jgi:hypothetical protein
MDIRGRHGPFERDAKWESGLKVRMLRCTSYFVQAGPETPRQAQIRSKTRESVFIESHNAFSTWTVGETGNGVVCTKSYEEPSTSSPDISWC